MICKRCLGKLYFKHIITTLLHAPAEVGTAALTGRSANMTTLTEKELNGNGLFSRLIFFLEKNHLKFLRNKLQSLLYLPTAVSL